MNKIIKITGGCYEYWHRDFSGEIFRVVDESEESYYVVPIEGVTKKSKYLDYLLEREKSLPVAKYNAEIIERSEL